MAVTGAEPISAANLAAALGSGVRFASDEDALAYLYGINESFQASCPIPGSSIASSQNICSISGKTVTISVMVGFNNLSITSGTGFLTVPDRYRPADGASLSGELIIKTKYERLERDFAFEGGQFVVKQSISQVSSMSFSVTYEAANVSGATGGEAVTLEQMLQVLNRI